MIYFIILSTIIALTTSLPLTKEVQDDFVFSVIDYIQSKMVHCALQINEFSDAEKRNCTFNIFVAEYFTLGKDISTMEKNGD